MDREAFFRLLEETLEKEPNSIKGTETLEQLDWDSLGVVSYLALADEHFGTQLAAKQVNACKTVAELVALLGDKVAP